MLLCDYIVFWQKHYEHPEIKPDTFNEALFNLAVAFSVAQAEVIRAVLTTKIREMLKETTAIFEREGKAGVRGWYNAKFNK
jgi:hypothetical protein